MRQNGELRRIVRSATHPDQVIRAANARPCHEQFTSVDADYMPRGVACRWILRSQGWDNNLLAYIIDFQRTSNSSRVLRSFGIHGHDPVPVVRGYDAAFGTYYFCRTAQERFVDLRGKPLHLRVHKI